MFKFPQCTLLPPGYPASLLSSAVYAINLIRIPFSHLLPVSLVRCDPVMGSCLHSLNYLQSQLQCAPESRYQLYLPQQPTDLNSRSTQRSLIIPLCIATTLLLISVVQTVRHSSLHGSLTSDKRIADNLLRYVYTADLRAPTPRSLLATTEIEYCRYACSNISQTVYSSSMQRIK